MFKHTDYHNNEEKETGDVNEQLWRRPMKQIDFLAFKPENYSNQIIPTTDFFLFFLNQPFSLQKIYLRSFRPIR